MKSLLLEATHAYLALGREVTDEKTFLCEILFFYQSTLCIDIVLALVLKRFLIAGNTYNIIVRLLFLEIVLLEDCWSLVIGLLLRINLRFNLLSVLRLRLKQIPEMDHVLQDNYISILQIY